MGDQERRDEARLYVAQGLAYQEQGREDLARRMLSEGAKRMEVPRTQSSPSTIYPTDPLLENGRPSPSCPPLDEDGVLFSVDGGVQLFYVGRDGSVRAPHPPSALTLRACGAYGTLEVGPWRHALRPGAAPALQSAYGAILFPDGPDTAVGVILPPSVSPEEREKFLQLLSELTGALREQRLSPGGVWHTQDKPAARKTSVSEHIAKGVVVGAEYVSAGLARGAHATSELLRRGAQRMVQGGPCADPRPVPTGVAQGARVARDASGVALKATGCLVRKVGELAECVGRQVAPHVPTSGNLGGLMGVAAGGIQGFSTIYTGLENAAKILANSLSSETVTIVGHKYGAEVGDVVGDALSSIGNLALTTHNVQSLGVKAIAKKTAKEAGKAALMEYAEHVPRDQG